MQDQNFCRTYLVSKYADHLPLHRQERIFKREGLALSKSTLSDWVQGSTAMLARIIDAMWNDAHDAPIVLSDATGT
jgi:transposase